MERQRLDCDKREEPAYVFLKVGLVCQHTEPGHANKLPPCTRTTRNSTYNAGRNAKQ